MCGNTFSPLIRAEARTCPFGSSLRNCEVWEWTSNSSDSTYELRRRYRWVHSLIIGRHAGSKQPVQEVRCCLRPLQPLCPRTWDQVLGQVPKPGDRPQDRALQQVYGKSIFRLCQAVRTERRDYRGFWEECFWVPYIERRAGVQRAV